MLATFQIPPIDPGAPLWGLYDAAYGITLNNASLAQPTAFDNAAWTKQDCTVTADATTDPFGASLADKITEGSLNTAHVVFQNASNYVNGLPVEFTVYGKAGTRSWLLVAANTGSSRTYVNLATGTFGSQAGLLSRDIVSLGNGWYKMVITYVATSAEHGLYMSTGDGISSYLGDGISFFYLYGTSITQPKVQQWTDQSLNPATGALNGHDLIQAVAAKQMLYTLNGWNGRPVLRADGVDDMMQTLTATLNQPTTIIASLMMNTLTAASSHDIVFDGFSLGGLPLEIDTTPRTQVTAGLTYPVAAANKVAAVFQIVSQGASSTLSINNAKVATGVGPAGNAAGFTLGSLSDGSRSVAADFLRVAIFSGAMSDWSSQLWTRWFMAHAHPSVLA